MCAIGNDTVSCINITASILILSVKICKTFAWCLKYRLICCRSVTNGYMENTKQGLLMFRKLKSVAYIQ